MVNTVADRNKIKTKTGKPLSDITVEAVMRGDITREDLQISRETLARQRDTALSHDRPQLAANFDRAGELTEVPDEMLLKIYDMLRPYRSTKEELKNISETLKNEYNARKCAELIDSAVIAYEKAGIFRTDDEIHSRG